MSIEERQQQTTVNVQEKANLIWAIADKLVGVYKPHEYGNVILPMCVVKRFEDTLAPTKQKVLDMNKQLDADGITVKQGFLEKAAGQKFYNLSPFTFETLLSDPENIRENFESYLNHFSENVIDVIHRMKFQQEIETMAENNLLYLVIKEFCTEKAYLGADKVSSVDMGYIFEELVRKFSESYDEHAGAHFTARDIINLMTELLVGEDEERLEVEGISATIYDMAMGTSQMLGCMSDRLLEIDPDADITTYGQELNEQTFAIAKADTLIKGGNADNMRQGDTLGDDQFEGYKFDYIISNPPFGIEWKTSKAAVEAENKKGAAGRFEPGLPAIGDGQQLFLLNGVAKLKDTGRMAIIQNGSPLFKGDAGSGESNIRGYLLENDWLEAIVQLPNDLFYNTGIATYIWVITRNKSAERQGKVQLIDASQCYEKRRKPLGNKRVEITEAARQLIMQAYHAFYNGVVTKTAADGTEICVESKVRENAYFKYSKLFIMNPERDAEGNVVKDKKGKPVFDKSLNDTEIIPWLTDKDEYLQKNVAPYSPDFVVDEKKTKIGYEIPFTREFYKYTPLKPSADIFEELKTLEQQESELMEKLLH
jgi:type I restriction enzyme M protein